MVSPMVMRAGAVRHASMPRPGARRGTGAAASHAARAPGRAMPGRSPCTVSPVGPLRPRSSSHVTFAVEVQSEEQMYANGYEAGMQAALKAAEMDECPIVEEPDSAMRRGRPRNRWH